jgi:hypothetical protein
MAQLSLQQLQLAHMAQQALAGRGGAHRLAAHQHGLPQLFFQLANALRHRRRGDAQPLRGQLKTASADNGFQRVQGFGVEHG